MLDEQNARHQWYFGWSYSCGGVMDVLAVSTLNGNEKDLARLLLRQQLRIKSGNRSVDHISRGGKRCRWRC